MAQATLSSKHQMVIPGEAREALDLRAGDKVLVVVRGKRVLVLQKPDSYRAAIRGLMGKRYPSQHVKKERQSWEESDFGFFSGAAAGSRSTPASLFTNWSLIPVTLRLPTRFLRGLSARAMRR